MRHFNRVLFALLIIFCASFSLNAQNVDKPNLFLDCNRCFQSYIKENVALVNYVRDKNDAQIHLLITRARTGSDGIEYTLSFIGQNKTNALKDTLVYVSPASDTNENTRRGLVNYIKIGLIPYLSNTSLIQYMEVNFAEINEEQNQQKDKWNNWVFEIGGFTSLSGEETRNSFEFNGEVSANRITKDWKIELQADARYERDQFELDDEQDFTSVETRREFESLAVKSLSPHWSAGLSSQISSSSFRNIKLQIGASPAVEYNIYPYAEYNEHEFNFLYKIAPTYFQYQDTTIFNETEEFLVEQSLEINYQVTQTWGAVQSSLEGSTFLHDLSKNRIDFRGQINFRIFRGLSLNLFGNYSLINDQIALPKEDATDEEALLRLRQQATGFEYRVGLGLSYTFGSIYNSIVNPRF